MGRSAFANVHHRQGRIGKKAHARISKSGEQVSLGRRDDALQFATMPDDKRRIRGAGLQLDPQGRHWAAHIWKSIRSRGQT
jgi:hypothetical protein